MRQSLPDTTTDETEADVVTVQAATAEEAIAEVHERLGADARIEQAEKVLRGGLWGFFPKQVVQLTARPAVGPDDVAWPEPAADEPLFASRPAVATPAATSADASAGGLDAVLTRLSAEHDDAEEGLGATLRRHLGVTIGDEAPVTAGPRTPAPLAAPATPATPVTPAADDHAWRLPSAAPDAPRVRPVTGGEPDPEPRPVGLAAALGEVPPPEATSAPAATPVTPATPPTPAAAELPGPPERPATGLPLEDVEYTRPSGSPWSGRGLLMLGLPRALVDAVLAQDPIDDAGWTYAVSRALAPLCRPLPTGPAAIVGPRASRLGRALGVPLVRVTDDPDGSSTFAVSCTDSARARTWLATRRGSRWTHVVVGGGGWRTLLFDGPLAVSWVGDDAVGEAIRTAHDLGMVLGPGVRGDADATLVEPSPIELAMLLRSMLGGGR